jgi:hypothetical protein
VDLLLVIRVNGTGLRELTHNLWGRWDFDMVFRRVTQRDLCPTIIHIRGGV